MKYSIFFDKFISNGFRRKRKSHFIKTFSQILRRSLIILSTGVDIVSHNSYHIRKVSRLTPVATKQYPQIIDNVHETRFKPINSQATTL